MRKIIPLTICFILILCGVSGIANSSQNLNNVESKMQDAFYLEISFGFLRPGIFVRVGNDGNEAFDGYISGNISIDAPIIICGNKTSYGPEYFHIEPGESVIVNHSSLFGFGKADIAVSCDPPVEITIEIRRFIFLMFIIPFAFWDDW